MEERRALQQEVNVLQRIADKMKLHRDVVVLSDR